MKNDRQLLFDTMISLVSEKGILNITLEMLCKEAKISTGSFSHIVGYTFAEFKRMFSTSPNIQYAISRKRLDVAIRREQICKEGVLLAAREGGILNVTIPNLSKACNISDSTITHHFSNTHSLRRAILSYGVAIGNDRVSKQAAILYPEGVLTSHE